jgi:hypothetical protein
LSAAGCIPNTPNARFVEVGAGLQAAAAWNFYARRRQSTRSTCFVSAWRKLSKLAEAKLPPKKGPDVIDALVVIAAALHGPAQILTSDPDDITACAATLDRADIVIERI